MRKKYPSQIKYEKNNPTITFRVKTHEYEKIKQMVWKSGKNVSELVRIALLALEKDFSTAFENAKKQEINRVIKRVMQKARRNGLLM